MFTHAQRFFRKMLGSKRTIVESGDKPYVSSSNGHGAESSPHAAKAVAKMGEYNDQRSKGRKASSRSSGHVSNGCPDRNRRNTGQQEIRSGPVGQGRSESARAEIDTGKAQRDRAPSSKREVGMIIPAFSAARTMCEIRGWALSNLELQKLLYLAEMTMAGRSDGQASLVSESFEAWDYGPVLPSVYHRAKAFGDKRIPDVFRIAQAYKDERRDVIEEVAAAFEGWTPGELVALTHRDNGAWAKHYIPGSRGVVIPRQDILLEYHDLVD